MRVRWGIGAAVLVLATACSDDGDTTLGLDESLLPGPGTMLSEGFAVPEATRLVGPVPTGENWNVDLVLVGDPRDAVDDVVEQATAAGLRVDARCSGGPQHTSCSVRGLRHDEESVFEEVFLQLERSSGGAPYRSGGVFTHGTQTRAVGRGVEGLVDDPGPLPRPPLPPADRPPDLPDVGEPIADDVLLVGADLVLAEGSEVVVPVTPSGCATGGFEAHLVITGEVNAVVGAYEEQFEQHAPGSVTRSQDGGVLRLYANELGGLGLSLEVLTESDPTWATLTGCND